MSLRALSLLAPLLACACAPASAPDGGARPDAGFDAGASEADAGRSSRRIQHVHFRARVGDLPFQCGTAYQNLGTQQRTWRATNLRLLVSNVRLLDAAGAEHPLALMPNQWQGAEVALLDFEDGSGECAAAGDSAQRDFLEGTLEGGTGFAGVRFDVAIPAHLADVDPSRQAVPLEHAGLYLDAARGYRLAIVDGLVGDTGALEAFDFELHRAGCAPCDAGCGAACAFARGASVEVRGYDPERNIVLFDLARLFAGSSLRNTPGSAPGCSSEPSDPDCAPLLDGLGVSDGSGAARMAAAFRYE